MSKAKVSLGVTVALFASLLLPVLVAAPAAAVAPQNIQSTLAGCKPNPASSYVVTAGPPASAICTVNGNYTTGNLGKSWNELDLVPFRLTMRQQGGNPPSPQTYQVAIVLDAEDGGAPGYDVISVPTKNTALSTGGAGNCAISATGDVDGTEANLGGGIDLKRYRILTITQTAGTTCVFDYYGRLAVGAHLFPGSSLHANLADENLGGGQADVSIPVNEISPQELDKTMVASQDADHTWTIDKDAAPAHLEFGNVCDPAVPTSMNTKITVTWDRLPADPSGVINIHTVVEATNPAARAIRVKVTDDLRSGTTVLESHDNGLGILVPANAIGYDVLTYDTTVPASTEDINDIATAEYIDDLTGVNVPGQTTAVFPPIVNGVQEQLDIQDGTITNAEATITDTESITGAGLSFSVDGPASGTFTNYTAGDVVSPGGTVEWDSGTQSGGGSITFDKTVYLDASVGATSGTLDDTATLTGIDGFTVDADASVEIDSTLAGSLVINKTTSVPVDKDTNFTFNVTGGNPAIDVDVVVTILEGETSGTTALTPLTGLTAGNYNVEETDSGEFTPADDQQFTIGAGACAAELDFENTFGPASLQVFKVTVPDTEPKDGFTFAVTKDGQPFDTGTSDATGIVQWDTAGSDTIIISGEGQYVVTETGGPTGFDSDGGVGDCDFTVDFPGDADNTYSCTFTNTKQGSIEIRKVTVPSPDATDTSFSFTRDFGTSPVSMKNGGSDTVGGLVPGTYSVAETVPAGWALDSFTCDDGSEPDAIDLAAGENVICTATNSLLTGNIVIQKETLPDGSTQEFEFDTNYGTNFFLADGESDDSGQLSVLGSPYSAAEINIPAGWALDSFTCDNSDDPSAITVIAGGTVTCTATNEQQGQARVIKTFSGARPPASATYTFTLRTGASQGVAGSTLETLVLNDANNFTGTFNTFLVPGDPYQLCEENVPVGGHSDLSDLPGAFSPGQSPADNSTQCAPFTVVAGETKTFTVNNTPPPGGDTRTIGYWKNWASCSGSKGKQAPILDQTLFAAGVNGISIGDLVLHGGATANLSPDCLKAIRILDKSNINTGKKMASDPAFNLAAQLLAAKLNVVAGAGTCPAATTAIAQAQALLDTVNFDGTKAPTMTAAQKTLANSLAATLDAYNNGGLCP